MRGPLAALLAALAAAGCAAAAPSMGAAPVTVNCTVHGDGRCDTSIWESSEQQAEGGNPSVRVDPTTTVPTR